jgi:ABC-type multidrug transport system ATPase subunit
MEPVVIGFDHVAKRYGTVQALSEISFEVPRGSVLSLLGPNGAGKTSCVRILATLTRPDAGRVVVGGHDVRTAPDSVRRLIGMVGQHPAVDDRLTGRENLILLGRLTGSRGAAARARAADLLEQFGLASVADRTVRTYSGGMRRRIDLAAALVHKPAVLLLDEPSAGLDPSARAQLWQLVREVVGFGTTVLLTTQYLEEADNLADRVLVLDGGRVGADGTPDEL